MSALYTKLDPEDTEKLKRSLRSWPLCGPLLGSRSCISSFLRSRRPSPHRAAGDLAPQERSSRTTPASCAGLWSQEWTYSSMQWATSRACTGLPLGVRQATSGDSPVSSWHPRRSVLDSAPDALTSGHFAPILLGHSSSASVSLRPFPESSLHHRGED